MFMYFGANKTVVWKLPNDRLLGAPYLRLNFLPLGVKWSPGMFQAAN